jgi:hypothetical protein
MPSEFVCYSDDSLELHSSSTQETLSTTSQGRMRYRFIVETSRRRAAQSLPSPANDVGFNLMVGPDAAPPSINPTTGKRKHVGAIVIFTKQFHQFPGWRFAI